MKLLKAQEEASCPECPVCRSCHSSTGPEKSPGGGGEPPLGRALFFFPFRGILCFPLPHMVSPEMVRAWGHLKVAGRSLQPLPGRLAAEVRAVAGVLVGVEGTGLSEAGQRAEPNATSCHSGCSSSSFHFFLLNTCIVLFRFVLQHVGGAAGRLWAWV